MQPGISRQVLHQTSFSSLNFTVLLSVPPAELESVLLSHPGVADVAVIGIEDAAQATELPR